MGIWLWAYIVLNKFKGFFLNCNVFLHAANSENAYASLGFSGSKTL